MAVRQAVYTSGRQRFNGQVLGVAQRTGQDLIEVSSTPNCRPSHEVINGKIFSISGQDRRYPKWTADLEALTHDYNCGHSVAIYHEGMERVFSDPLEGTGYSVEEARKAYAKQRRYENQIRKQKRTVEALKAAGLDTREANAQLNALRHRLKKHIEGNSAILRRERHREQLYDSAQRMKVAGETLSAPSLSGQRALSIEIDEMTPCLRRLSDNQLVKTTFKQVNPKKGEYSGWLFNWNEIAKDPDVDIVLELNAEGDNRPQGLLAMKDRPENKTVAVADVETAPHNRTFKNGIDSKEYSGVGAHLFAEAVKRSYELGFDGVIEHGVTFLGA